MKKKLLRSTNSENEKAKSWFPNHSTFLYKMKYKIQSYLNKKLRYDGFCGFRYRSCSQ